MRGPRLNWRLILPIVCGAVLAVGAACGVCFVVALANGDGAAVAFGVCAAVFIPVALLGIFGGGRLGQQPLRPRDGLLAVTLAWTAASVLGAVPFLAYGTFGSPVDAVFESASGFTTTGATLIADIEAQPHAVLMWRSISQWMGGVGIVVLVVALAPAAGLATQKVFYAESSGLPQDRLTPRIADTAKIIAGLYVGLTALCAVAFIVAGMGLWDAVNHAMTTIATGGFSTRTESTGAFDSLPVELVTMTFMVVAGINFAFYWRAMRGKNLGLQAEEVRVYLSIIAVAVLALSVALLLDGGSFGQSVRDGAFAAVSVGTGTGFATADFGLWSEFSKLALLGLMFVGGCAGSTTGGLKVFRVLMLAKTVRQELRRQLQPAAVLVLRSGRRTFSEDIRRGVLAFFLLYMTVWFAGTLALAVCGMDELTAASASASSLNVVGPGVGEYGALGDYGDVSDPGLCVLTALMLIGRLEVFTVVALLTPAFWRRTIA